MKKCLQEIKQIEERMQINRDYMNNHAQHLHDNVTSKLNITTTLASGFLFGLIFALKKKSLFAALLALGMGTVKTMRVVTTLRQLKSMKPYKTLK